MDDKSLEILEFPRIKDIIAGYTSFSGSRELALSLRPVSDYKTVSLLLNRSAEARHLLSREPGFSIGGVRDVREQVKMAVRGRMLEPMTLVEIQNTIASISRLRGGLEKLANEFHLLWDVI